MRNVKKWDDDPDDDEGDEGEWSDDDSESPVRPCPFCHQDVYEEADVCPHCGNFIIWDEASGTVFGHRGWLFVGAIMVTGIVASMIWAVIQASK